MGMQVKVRLCWGIGVGMQVRVRFLRGIGVFMWGRVRLCWGGDSVNMVIHKLGRLGHSYLLL